MTRRQAQSPLIRINTSSRDHSPFALSTSNLNPHSQPPAANVGASNTALARSETTVAASRSLAVSVKRLALRASPAGALGPLSGVRIGRLSGVSALWDCVPRVCGGGGGCAGGGVPLGAVLVLCLCGEVSLAGILIIIAAPSRREPPPHEPTACPHSLSQCFVFVVVFVGLVV